MKGYRLSNSVSDKIIKRCDVIVEEEIKWSQLWPDLAVRHAEATADKVEPDIFVVERIINHCINPDGDGKFRIKWKHYPVTDAKWKPVSSLIDCTETLDKYCMKAMIPILIMAADIAAVLAPSPSPLPVD